MTRWDTLHTILIWVALVARVLGQETRTFKLSLTRGPWAPNGHSRQVILVNGQFPAPTLKVSQGDHVVVEVENHIDDITSIHFHGR